ncbi:fascin-3 isoform X2 [Pyxicephalus adspersus]|uniref:Fascin n=1 Tax=Pyxicephalus adspersus TaxID=30357 RepID=A0AAV3AX13_PYXAD|nr:TPA: hypothetical protein GDO54_007311 [Pyxicephalus adspersus]
MKIWEMTQVNTREGKPVVFLKSQEGLNLLVTKEGNVNCGYTESPEHLQGLFLLIVHQNKNWSLKSLSSQKYLESDEENVFCSEEVLSPEHQWTPHLALHAHVVLYHPQSDKYAQTDVNQHRVLVDISTPYLETCGFVLRFRSGKYYLETANHLFLSSESTLEQESSPKTAFAMDLRPGCRARFINQEGLFMYPQGTQNILLPGQKPFSNQEWFVIRRCPPWVSLKSRKHGYLTIFYGKDVKANSQSLTINSVFHYEMDTGTRMVRLSDKESNYLALRKRNIILANGSKNEKETAYKVRWTFGKMYLRACNDAYLSICDTGYVLAKTNTPGADEEFILRLYNRSFLVLKGCYGYIGQSSDGDIVQCNRPVPECIEIIPCKMIIYYFKGQGKMFWNMTNHKTFHSNGQSPGIFYIEIRGKNILTIMTYTGMFLRGDKSGILIGDSDRVTSECLWEF